MTETWEDRYKRAVATYAGVPADVPLEEITITVDGNDGAYWSSITFEDPDIDVVVRWGTKRSANISGPEAVAGLIRSFLSPGESP